MGEPTGRKVFMRVTFLVFFLIIITGIVLFFAYGAYGDEQSLDKMMLLSDHVLEQKKPAS